MMVGAGMVAGGLVAFGYVLIAAGMIHRPQPLAEALTRLTGDHQAPAGRGVGDVRAQSATWLARVLARAGIESRDRDRDLLVAGRTREQYLVDKLVGGVGGLAAPALLAIVGWLSGVDVPPAMIVIASAGLAVVGFVLPDARVRRLADERRRGFRYALSSYLDVVNVMLAAGAGVETALSDAADAGQGWAFKQLRAVLARAQLAGESPWRAFRRLGDELDLRELRELASGLELAGTHGARVRASLQVRAQALRARDLADMEARAEAATERMAVPSVVLVIGFIVFVGFPAAQEILGF